MQHHGMPMIQEYISGSEKPNYNLLLDKKGELKVGFCRNTLRYFFRISSNVPTAAESIGPHPDVMHATKLVQKLGWWGGTLVETKVDSRDGIPKLMEINPRIGQHLWRRTELGINEPLMCLHIAREKEVAEVKEYPLGVLFLDPLEDICGLGFRLLDLLVYKFRIGVQKKAPIDPSNPPMTVKQLVNSYRETYLSDKKKVFNPYFRYFFQDPLVSILWWFQFSRLALSAIKQLGR